MATSDMTVTERKVKPQRNAETLAWSWMRYSGFLLIFLAFGHVIIQDVLTGPHRIDLDYVQMRWASIGWRIFDGLLLAFAFAHGMNGLRQVLFEFIKGRRARVITAWALLVVWLAITIVGAIALVGGVSAVAQ